MTTARRLLLLSSISCASLYVLGSQITTFDVDCCTLAHFTTFPVFWLFWFFPYWFVAASTASGSSIYSYSYSSSIVKNVLILFLNPMVSPHYYSDPTNFEPIRICVAPSSIAS